MANFAPPTFSLGFEFDLDSEPQTTVREDPTPKSAPQPSNSATLRTIQDFADDDFESPAMEPEDFEAPRSLKRLRRGLNKAPQPAARNPDSVDLGCNVDDDIEEFSSQEDKHKDEPLSGQPHSVCKSSNFPLPGHGFVTTQSTRQKKQDSNAPSSSNLETTSTKFTFPKITMSPVRRFQLIDSDSDDTSISEGEKTAPNKTNSYSKGPQSDPRQNLSSKEQRKTKASKSATRIEDLWSDFADKSFHIPTPALDEVCEEYFKSVENKNKTKGISQSDGISKNFEQKLNPGDPLPPAHRYFFSSDPRIQELVRSRLQNFFPLGAVNNEGFKQPTSSVIDYMGQFNKGESSRPTARKNNGEVSSTRSRKSTKKSRAEEVPGASSGWVNPRVSGEIPKDAGQRRVRAVGQSAGHWYMGPNGKRVYVTKDGKELSGQTAYRHYKKESGGGFKRSKKKATTRKKK